MPDRFGKKCGSSWRTWSYLARDFAGVAHPALKQAMKTVEKKRQPITAQDTTDFGATMELDQELQHFLLSRTEGGALETVRGAERQPALKQWRRLAAMYDQLAAGRSFDDSRQIFSPTKVTKLRDLSRALQAWENLEQRHQERTGYETCDAPGKGVDSTATPVPGLPTSACAYCDSYQHPYSWPCSDGCGKIGTVKLVTVMQEATRTWKVRTDNCTAWRSRTARESLPRPRAKAATKVGVRKVKLTQNVSGAGALATSELDCRAKSRVNGAPRKSAPRGNGVVNCQDEEQETL